MTLYHTSHKATMRTLDAFNPAQPGRASQRTSNSLLHISCNFRCTQCRQKLKKIRSLQPLAFTRGAKNTRRLINARKHHVATIQIVQLIYLIGLVVKARHQCIAPWKSSEHWRQHHVELLPGRWRGTYPLVPHECIAAISTLRMSTAPACPRSY